MKHDHQRNHGQRRASERNWHPGRRHVPVVGMRGPPRWLLLLVRWGWVLVLGFAVAPWLHL